MIGVIGLCNQILLSFIPFDPTVVTSRETQPMIDPRAKDSPRPLKTIFLQPSFLLACGTATLSNTAMMMIMSQFSLDMNRHQYEFRDISLVLEFHLLAMYSPSFITGYLLNLTSPLNLSIIGNVIYLMGIVVMYSVSEYFGYSVGMILIGIAWNFSYSSSTLLLSDCYRVDYSVTLLTLSFLLISPVNVANGGLSRARSKRHLADGGVGNRNFDLRICDCPSGLALSSLAGRVAGKSESLHCFIDSAPPVFILRSGLVRLLFPQSAAFERFDRTKAIINERRTFFARIRSHRLDASSLNNSTVWPQVQRTNLKSLLR
jgi:hypothetical protein